MAKRICRRMDSVSFPNKKRQSAPIISQKQSSQKTKSPLSKTRNLLFALKSVFIKKGQSLQNQKDCSSCLAKTPCVYDAVIGLGQPRGLKPATPRDSLSASVETRFIASASLYKNILSRIQRRDKSTSLQNALHSVFLHRPTRQKLTASILTFVMLFQIIAGIFAPVNIFNLKKNEAHAGWFDMGYGYKKEIKVDHTKVTNTDQTNFPMLVSFTDPLLKTVATGGRVTDANGYDIIFTNASGSTKLDHEIEKYVPTTGEIVMWVKIPVLSASTDTSIYIYYGNSAITTTQENKTGGVWDDGTAGGGNFKGVWHLGETTRGAAADFKDSTVNHNDSTNITNEPTAATGQIDGAGSFNGSSSYVDAGSGSSLNVNSALSISAWIYPTSLPSVSRIVNKESSSSGSSDYELGFYNNKLNFTSNALSPIEINSNSTFSVNTMYHVVAVYTGSAFLFYVNGVFDRTVSVSGTIGTSANHLQIGRFSSAYPQVFSGSLDEVRISNTARSADWISTEYNNQSQPTEFSTLGIEEVSGPVALSSFAYRKAITIDHTKVSGATNLTNFPVLINLPTDDSLKAHAQSAGNDILFTSSTVAWSTGTTNDKLAHEIETYTASNGSFQAWVKIPSLNSASATQDTVIYMYYGNATATNQQNKTAAWDTNTKMVQHLKETGTNPTVYDSTQYANNSTAQTWTPTTAGQIDGAGSFNGTSNNITITPITTLGTTFTASVWMKGDGTGGVASKHLLDIRNSVVTHAVLAFRSASGDVFFRDDSGVTPTGGQPAITYSTDNTWHQYTAIANGTNAITYKDGIQVDSKAWAGSLSLLNSFKIASDHIPNNFFNGSLDEVRISNTARSAGWIATEYNNQSQPIEFSSLGIEEVSVPVALSSFAYRKAITIDHTKVSGGSNLTNFPVLINLPTDASLQTHAQDATNGNGGDILFTSSTVAWNTGTTNDKLAHEIETYTASSGSLQAWVKVPTLYASNANQDTVIYMYYGNAIATSQQNKTAVWDTNTKMVQHMNQNPGGTIPQMIDSTQFANNGTSNGGMTSGNLVAGQADGATSFDGSNDYIDTGMSNLSISNAITLESWVNVTSKTNNTYPGIVGRQRNNSDLPGGGGCGTGYALSLGWTTTLPDFFLTTSGGGGCQHFTGSTALSLNTWYHVVGTYDASSGSAKIYINGIQNGSTHLVGQILASTFSTTIGRRYNLFTGSLDEVRISNTARSAGWIATEYNNQSQPTEFSTLGIEEVSSPSALSTFAYRKAITIDHTKVSGTTNLTNFPVLINLPTDDSLKAHAQNPSGNDILFTSSTVAWNTGTTNDKLAHEIETYTASNGSLQAWVKIPSLNSASASQDTVIYMYYGNASIASQQNKTAVWDANNKMVQHMNQTGNGAVGDYKDSTQYGNNSTNTTGQPTVTTSGQVGSAEGFSGSSKYIGINNPVLGNSQITVCAWVKKSAYLQYQGIVSDWTTVVGKRPFILGYENPSGTLSFLVGNGASTDFISKSGFSQDVWHYVCGTFVGNSSLSLYIDGVSSSKVTSIASIDSTTSYQSYIGRYSPYYFNGSLDEVRISNTARSADWISTEYNNQSIPLKTESTPTGFLALGAENIYRLEITGSSTQTAGTSQSITLTAKDVAGNIMANFTGDNTLTLGGASASPNNTAPTCSDKNAADIPFGTPTTLAFANGVATCNMKLYKAETASVTSTGIATTTSNLSITVSPNALNNFLVDAPASGNSGTAFATDITSRDAYNNTRTVSGATALTVNQGGTITPTSISSSSFTDDGVWSGNLTITNITENPSVAITATNDIYTGTDSISILGIPTTPQNASATRNTDDSMTLTWQDRSTVETGYKIERRDNTGSGFGDYAQIGIVAANISIFTDNTPYPDRSYQYRVRAYNSIGNSAAYAEDSIIHYTTPDMPSNVFGTYLSDTSFSISYTDQTDVTDTHHIQRCSNANCSDTFETDLNTFTSSPQIDTTSIYPDSRYRWEVRAEASSITSNYEVSDFEYTTPSTPIIQNTTFVSNTQLNVNWTDSSSYEDGFRIEVSTDNGAYAEVTPGENTVGAGITSYAFTSIADHNYKFKVRSHIGSTPHNAELFSAYSAESSTVYTTSNSPTMQAPTVTSSTSILWNWTDTSAFEELFHLHFAVGSGTNVNDIPADSTSYETTNLTPNTKYSTHIHSYRSDTGESDPSADSAETYTFANTPSNLTLTPDSQDQITARWNANQNPIGTKYFIENINTGANSTWTADTSWASNNLMCSTEYSFRIKARNESSIETSYSPIATIKTINCSPGLPIGSADPPQVPVATPDNPMGSFDISINDGNKYTNNTNVKLTFLAGADTTRMAISNSQDFSQASIIPYAKEGRWDISANAQDRQGSFGVPQDDNNQDGTYTVYAKFYTQYGIASQTVSDSIILDTTPPTLIINNFKAKYLTTDNIIIQGTTEPNTKVIYNLDSQRAGVIDIGTDGKLTLSLGTLTAGIHSLKLITQDQLGNSSDTMQFFLNVEKPIVIIPSIPTTPTRPTTPVYPTPTNPTNPTSPITPSRPTTPTIPTTPSHPTIPSNPTTQPGTTTPTQPAGINVPSTDTPTTNNPSLNTPDLNNPSTNNPDLCTNNVTPETPVSMQGSWNLLSFKPFPKDITTADIQMIIEKFPEFKETFQNLGLEDFSNAERLKNVSFNIPNLSEVMGLNPTGLTALNLPNANTPLTELSSSFKKEIPSNIVFVKTKENGIDINSALSFEDGNPNQRINLLSGQSFELVLRPDQDVNSIQGYITFKESKLSRTDNTTIIEKVANLFNFNKSALAEQDIEEKLVLSGFEYQDDDKDGLWTANIQTPQVSGEYELITVLNYKDICLGSKTLRLITVVDPEGYVYRTEVDGEKTRISNATVSIYWFNSETKKYELWDAGKYQQKNPQTTDDRGTYSFLVPPGSYYLKAEAAGYANYQSDPFDVTVGSGVHMNLEIKRQMDWRDSMTWQNMLLVVFGIGLFYNFYSDRKKWKRMKKKEMV